jgi:hypothetical protein
MTREFEVCVCDDCTEKGAKELYHAAVEMINDEKMNPFVNIKTIRLREGHGGEDVYVTLDGKRISAEKMKNIYATIKEK